jgi:hypothetical protein
MIPRIKLNNPEDDSLPFPMQRLQFPVKLSYCDSLGLVMTSSTLPPVEQLRNLKFYLGPDAMCVFNQGSEATGTP